MSDPYAKRLKVTIVVPPWESVVPRSSAGSVAIWTCEVARRLAQSCDMTVVAPRWRGQASVERDQRVLYRRLPIGPDRVLLKLFGWAWRFRDVRRGLHTSALWYVGYGLQAALAARARRCDVVHIHSFSPLVLIVRALNPTARIVLHAHGDWLAQSDRETIARRLKGADAIVGCSGYATDAVKARFADLAGRCRTVLNGVDVQRFSPGSQSAKRERDQAQRLLFVGRISQEKGLHVLLDALEILIEKYPQAQLEIVGPTRECPKEFIVAMSDEAKVARLARFYDGEGYSSHLRRRAKRAALQDRVRWRGPMPYGRLVEHYRDADVLVNPSLSEAFGMTLIEAMATGIPVVASRVGGMVEVVEHGRTGLLVESGDAKALAGAICRLLADKKLARSLGRAGRERAIERFSWGRAAQEVLRLYEEVCRVDR